MGASLSRRFAPLLAATLLALGCGPPDPEAAAGRAFVERARAVHGAAVLDRATVRFTFRGDAFEVVRDGGLFRYTRAFRDTTGALVRDVLDNDGLRRERNGRRVDLDEDAYREAETVLNSVVYFALLPYNLADPAVRPRALGPDTVRGQPYERVEVTFLQEGGGRDWQDRFVYWIHAERGTMDYLAYAFHTGEGGTRFREAVDVRTVGGVRFADYLNYVADPDTFRLEAYPRLLEAGRLLLVSEVRLEDVRVEPLATREIP